MLGAQAAPERFPLAGGELGLALQRDHTGWRGGMHGGLFGSLGLLGIAWRGTFFGPGEGGVQSSLVFMAKLPIPIGGCPAPVCGIPGRPLRSGDAHLLPEVVAPLRATPALCGALLADGSAGQQAAEDERDPIVAHVHRTIAREESSHAALGRRVVEWCVHAGGAPVQRAVTGAGEELSDRGLGPRARECARAVGIRDRKRWACPSNSGPSDRG